MKVDAALRLPENATLEQAATLAATLPAALARGKGAFSVDASALKAYDTSTIALLLQAHRGARASGRAFTVTVTGAPAQLVQLAALYGVKQLLSVSSDGPRPRACQCLRSASGATSP